MSLASKGLISLIEWYRIHISANTAPTCKYYPTCSTYALTAVERFGAIRGAILTILRLLRCRPWSRGGIDDVPEKFSVFYRFSWSSAHEEPSIEPKYHPFEKETQA
ncbi:membrane protein insertion efficiency factor YidD [Alloscardovia theropitheci]|uniref:Putative membrane protein insertion efficiency factor n=1 Tax=Alloscardovia theropitheci TaxID=2496842 RepID=A0A4R0QPW3_9BIFI|nr:membrane protein insertion efficiency factor YidD [Alloscardovia theropitheci]TCD54294.1 membrane protein insertion efficiency factor YidD [Alloscardovia theropitheci]